MMSLWQSFDVALSGGGFAALPLALAGGVVMGLNPCCLAFYPAVAATCCAVDRGALAVRSAFAFVAGTAAATTLLGMLAAIAGHAVLGLGAWPRYAIAFVPLLMGTHLLGWARLPLPRAGAGWRRLAGEGSHRSLPGRPSALGGDRPRRSRLLPHPRCSLRGGPRPPGNNGSMRHRGRSLL